MEAGCFLWSYCRTKGIKVQLMRDKSTSETFKAANNVKCGPIQQTNDCNIYYLSSQFSSRHVILQERISAKIKFLIDWEACSQSFSPKERTQVYNISLQTVFTLTYRHPRYIITETLSTCDKEKQGQNFLYMDRVWYCTVVFRSPLFVSWIQHKWCSSGKPGLLPFYCEESKEPDQTVATHEVTKNSNSSSLLTAHLPPTELCSAENSDGQEPWAGLNNKQQMQATLLLSTT